MPSNEVVHAYDGGEGKNSKNTKDEDLSPEIEDDLENGPIFKRHCTDILCCPLFVAFCVGMAWAFIYGLANGDPRKLITLYDTDANGCGYTSGVKSYDYIYWPSLDYSADSGKTVCVKFCPTIANPLTSSDFFANSAYANLAAITTEYGNNANGDYDSVKYVNRFCIPDADSAAASSDSEYSSMKSDALSDYDAEWITQYIGDLTYCWWVCIVCALTAFVGGITYMFFIRCCGKYIVWVTILLGFLSLLALGIYVYATADNYDSEDDTRATLQWCAYIIFGLCVVYVLILLCCCSRIRLGIAIMKTAADFIKDTLRVFLVPIIFFLALCIWLVYWIVALIFIWSVGDVKSGQDNPFASISWNETTRYVFWYNLFGLFWVNAFIIGCCQFVLAVGVCTWYFTHTADSGGSAQLTRGFKWVLRYHLGSIAFGALIIAIAEFLRFLFNYYRKMMTSRLWSNKIMKCLFYMTKYLIDCINRVIKFITKHAYIQMALTSSNFCWSAWKAFVMILSNAGRFAVATILGWIFIFIGKIAIISGTVIVGYLIITNVDDIEKNISSPVFPCIVFGVIAYLVATIFLTIFGFAMDCILQSFLVDETLAGQDNYGAHRPKTMDAFAKQQPRGHKKCYCC
jgi:choline transporter-like protein 2/4/5